MEPQIYFVQESPDFNFMIEKGKIGRIAANRVALCIMTEFGLMNDRRMHPREFSSFIESVQITLGKTKLKKSKIIAKTVPSYPISTTLSNESSIVQYKR